MCYSRLKLICFLPAAKIRVLHIRGFSSIFSDQTTNAKRRRYLVSRIRRNKVVWDVASILKEDAIYIPLVLYSTEFSSFFPSPLFPRACCRFFFHSCIIPSSARSYEMCHTHSIVEKYFNDTLWQIWNPSMYVSLKKQ